MGVRSTLFGSRARVAVTLGLLLVVVVGGALAAGAFGSPTVTGVEASVRSTRRRRSSSRT
jgi:hypothetical protein